jgi:ATP-binding cassette, subfamily G (WHITE), member 2
MKQSMHGEYIPCHHRTTQSHALTFCLRGLWIFRYEILEMFDDIMILGQGGYCIYFGGSGNILQHFEDLGFKCEEHENPADMFLDVVAGSRCSKDGKTFTPYELHQKWQTHNVDMKYQMRDIVTDYQKEKQNSESGLLIIPPRKPVPFMSRFIQHFRRAYIQFFRDYERLFLSIFIHLLAGTVLGFSFSNDDAGLYTPGLHSSMVPFCPEIIADRCRNEPINFKDIRVLLFFTCMALNSASIIASIPFFGLEKVTFFREAPLGFGRSAYFLAKVTAALPLCGLNSFIYISSFYATACPNGRFASYFLIVFLMDLCGTALGYALSFLFTVTNAFVLSVVIAAASSVFCGAFPTLKEARGKFGIFHHLWDLNFDRWASEAIYIVS